MNSELIKYSNYYKSPRLWTVYNDFGGAPYIFEREYKNRIDPYLGMCLIHADDSWTWFPGELAKILNEWAWEFETASNLNMEQYIRTGIYLSTIIASYIAPYNIYLRYDTGNVNSNIESLYYITPELAEEKIKLNIYPSIKEYYKLENLETLWSKNENLK